MKESLIGKTYQPGSPGYSYMVPVAALRSLSTLKQFELGNSFTFKPVSYVEVDEVVKLLSMDDFGRRLTHLSLLNISCDERCFQQAEKLIS